MYHDVQGREIEDLEMNNMHQDWRDSEAQAKLQALREALEQQREYERKNWPFVHDDGTPAVTGESITYHLASLYQWSPGYVLTLPPEERLARLEEIWKSFSLAGDIIQRYENATEALLKEVTPNEMP